MRFRREQGKGQSSMEYLLLIGGAIMIVIVIALLIRAGILFPSENKIRRDQFEYCRQRLVADPNSGCYDENGKWDKNSVPTNERLKGQCGINVDADEEIECGENWPLCERISGECKTESCSYGDLEGLCIDEGMNCCKTS